MQYIIIAVLNCILVAIVLKFLTAKRGQKGNQQLDGSYYFNLNKRVFYILVGFLITGIGITITGFFAVDDKGNTLTFLLSFSLFVCLLGCWLLWFVFSNHKVVLSEKRLQVMSQLGKEHSILWEDINTIHFSSVKGSVVVTYKKDHTVSINQFIIGIDTILTMLNRKTGIAIDEINNQLLKH